MAFVRTLIVTAAFTASASLALAGGHGGNPAVKARKAHMQLYQHNVAILFGMAKGEVDYDADAASAAANNLATLSGGISQRTYWAPGTSNADLGEETRALPAAWESGSKAGEIGGQMADASAKLAAVAGDGLEALG
ncbi:MAG: cytochrome c, partial [Boseongicola sp.]